MYLKYHQGVGVSVLPLLDGGALDSCTASTMQCASLPGRSSPFPLTASLSPSFNP